MAFRIRASHLVAAAITVGIAGWMATGNIEVGGQQREGGGVPPIAEREAERSAELFKVSYVPLLPEERQESLTVRGRTEADAIVPIRVETGGILQKRLFDKGDTVEAGDIVCEIDTAFREAKFAQAQAQLAQAQSDYESNLELSEKGFSSEAKLRQMKAALEAAKALLAEARTELERTEVNANASGTVQDPIAEPGDMLKSGDVCVTLIDTDPMMFIGQVSERHIRDIENGMRARIELVSGDLLEGTVAYIAPSADAQTRTFRIEIELQSTDSRVRDGITASAEIALEPQTAYRISPSWISLADDGEIGLKTLDDEDVVQFVPVTISAQNQDGFWVKGPEPGMRAITRGHEYVAVGEKVDAAADPIVGAELDGAGQESGERTQ